MLTFPFFFSYADSVLGWRDLFNIAVLYRRLMDPEEPVLWLDLVPSHLIQEGFYTNTINFVR
jgi:hypothetical protein